ncbi:MAG TPA: hypothetical protein VFE61_08735 [Candidatus Sulfotelmatobacter sp.]|jgi:hypothetical protein|nr:hypothetical protein [Candidatus Sulfotelmatobacter sp.]
MSDPFEDSTARLEVLLKQAMNEDDPDRNDELCAEIWQVLLERDEARNALGMKSGDDAQLFTPRGVEDAYNAVWLSRRKE